METKLISVKTLESFYHLNEHFEIQQVHVV